MSKRFVVAGDLHLRERIWTSRPTLVDDSYYALYQIKNYCIENKMPLLLAGDIFQTKTPSSNDISVFRRAMDDLQLQRIPVYFIQGQHDMSTPPWPCACHPHPRYVGDSVFEPVPGFKVYGMDYKSSIEAQISADVIPETCKAVMLHQLVYEAYPKEGAWNFKTEWLPNNIKLVMLGDLHSAVDFKGAKGKQCFYTGSMHLQNIAEDPRKSFVVVTVKDNGDFEIERIPLRSRRVYKFRVDSNEELDKKLATMSANDIISNETIYHTSKYADENVTANNLIKPILIVEYLLLVDKVEERVRAVLGNHVHLFLSPVVETGNKAVDTELTTADSVTGGVVEISLVSCLDKYAQPGSSVHVFTNELLTTSSDTVFKNWKVKAGVD